MHSYFKHLKKKAILHLVREQSRIVVVFPEIRADRSVLSAGAHFAAWGSTTERARKKQIKREHRRQKTHRG